MAGESSGPSKGFFAYVLCLGLAVGVGLLGKYYFENKAILWISIFWFAATLIVWFVSLSVDSDTSDKAARAGQARREGNNLKELPGVDLEGLAPNIDWNEALARNADHEGH